MKRIAYLRRSLITSLFGIGAAFVASTSLAIDEALERNLQKISLPPGFKVDVFAQVEGARSMAFGQSTGTIFVGTRGDSVYAAVDKDKDRKADQVITMMTGLKMPNGVAVHQGHLYVAEQHRITRYPAPGFSLALPWDQMREIIYEDLPDKAHHGWRYIGFGPDEKLYVTVGAPCNICDPKGIEATIIRMNPDGSEMEVFAKGVRNSVGLDFHPLTAVIYFTDNGTDLMGDTIPPCEVNAAPKTGKHYGFPYYAGGSERHKDWADKKPPQDVTMPVVEFEAHVAPLGLRFYTGKMFPAEYHNDAFVAQHGSWNRSDAIGYRIMRIKFDPKGKLFGKEVFADGWLQAGEAWGRPVDLLQLPDGSLLVSDDYQGLIYRISYAQPGE